MSAPYQWWSIAERLSSTTYNHLFRGRSVIWTLFLTLLFHLFFKNVDKERLEDVWLGKFNSGICSWIRISFLLLNINNFRYFYLILITIYKRFNYSIKDFKQYFINESEFSSRHYFTITLMIDCWNNQIWKFSIVFECLFYLSIFTFV